MANLAASLGVGFASVLALGAATLEGHAQSSTPSINVASRPAQFRFVGQVMKLTFTAYSGSRVFSTASVDPRGFGPNVPVCDSPPEQTGATFTCTSTYTVTPLNMASGYFSGAPILKWTFPNGSKTGANVIIPIAPPETNPPDLTLPSDITVNTDATKPTAVVNYSVSTHDPEDDVADLLLTDGLAPGSAFPLGTTTVGYSATDPSGNVTRRSFNVTVEDHEAPVLTVPGDISADAPAGASGKAVTFTATATDNADANPVVSCAPASGSTFAIGETTVSCTATDASNNTSAAKTFKVTINDVTPPTLTVPSDISASTEAGKATAKVTYSATATDAGDPAPVVTCAPASGSDFAAGVNTVSCSATDASHNTSTAKTFTVTVLDNEAPVVTAPTDIIVGTSPGAASAVVSYASVTAIDNVDGAITPVQTAGLPSGATFPLGVTTVTFQATDNAGNKGTASFTVTVQDREGPVFTAPDNITIAAASGTASAAVTYTTPTATDNVDASPPVTCSPASGSSFGFGETIVECSARDTANNLTKHAFTVKVTDEEVPTLTMPAPITVPTDAGQPSAVVNYTNPTAIDAIDANPVVSCLPASGSTFSLGSTSVVCQAKDASGNTASASFVVVVEDHEAPKLALPADIVTTTGAGSSGAVVDYGTVSATDNVDGSLAATCGPPSGTFPTGITTVECSATDAAHNKATGSFKVTVNDGEAPVLTVPANIAVDTDAGKATAKVTYAVSATDAVDGAVTPELVAGLASGSDFPVGVTTVTYEATDAKGNISAPQSFTVTVTDAEPPVITVPADIVVNADPGKTSAKVTFTVSATDSVDGTVTPSMIAGLASGADFPIGTTSVRFRAVDSHNNTAEKSFTVTVKDIEPPVVTVPANISVSTDPGKTYATVTYSVSATDLFDGAVTPVQTAGLASGAHFPVGVTTVSFKATDGAGNASAEKSFTVTVIDGEAPVLSLPANISVSTDAGKTTAKVTYAVSATDLVDGDVTPQLMAGLASGADFPIGTTTVTYKATDKQGNVSAEQSFTVTVADGEPPVFSFVPANINVAVDSGQTQGTASWSEPTATDNAPGVTVTRTGGPASGSSFPLGTTTISYEARDTAGNTAAASFTVTVGTTPPGNVTFMIKSPTDGSFGFSSSEPALNVAVNSSGGHGSSGAITLPPGTYAFAFSVPNGVGIASAQCSDPASTINTGSHTGTLKVVSGGALSCTISTSDSADKAVALIGSFLESRANIILSNQPDIDRRIERLTGAYSGNGGINAFGMPIGGGQVPVGLQISADRTTFAYSMQRAQAGATGGESSQGDHGDQQAGGGQTGAGLAGAGQAGAGARQMMAAAGAQLPLSAYTASGKLPPADATFQHAFGPSDAAGADEAPAADPLARRFDIWTEGTLGRFKSGSGEGSFGIAHSGADYLLTPNVLVGLGLQVDWLNQDGADGATVSGVGYLVGPYATVRLSEHFYLDTRAGWGQSFNQVSPLGTFKDRFDGNRWLATAALIGSFDIERWKIKPEARVTMFEEKSEAYVDGLGVDVPSIDVRTGQFAFGPNISTNVQLEGGLLLTPFVDLQGIWTFMQDSTATAATATPGLSQTGLRGRAETGFELAAGNGMSINASAFYDGLGSSSYSAWGGKLGLSHRF
ncbi:HYR domain-containing protein [Mesorhizobium sp. INR15]|uniref:HYR domain-containing protein n=1 Tax=Mesorhizobium sp. INR15 TaxID=2654248 RepID=UPI0018969C2C|nr:HYR domain-containing protein [Mesorhizobium sp. INR15]